VLAVLVVLVLLDSLLGGGGGATVRDKVGVDVDDAPEVGVVVAPVAVVVVVAAKTNEDGQHSILSSTQPIIGAHR